MDTIGLTEKDHTDDYAVLAPILHLTANISQVPKRSPLRYPGGKTWMTPLLRLWLKSIDIESKKFIEPFAGGASASLLAVDEKLCDQAYFAELDPKVAKLWKCILSEEGPLLADSIVEFKLNKKNVKTILGPQRGRWSDRKKALAVIVQNRTQRGGIMAPGAGRLKEGENGNGLKSRWYPETLSKRIKHIHSLNPKLHFTAGDGFTILEKFSKDPNAIAFVDPPYYVAAERLYACWKMDHKHLFTTLSNFQGNFLLAYDDAPEIREWVKEFKFQAVEVAMKTTNHAKKNELIISRNLDWAIQRTPKSSQEIAPLVQDLIRENKSGSNRPAA